MKINTAPYPKLLETIRFDHGKFLNLELHCHRMNRAREKLFGCTDPMNLQNLLLSKITGKLTLENIYKCRIIYAKEIDSIEFIPYRTPAIHSLKLMTGHEIDYSFKYLDRSRLEHLYSQKGTCDDILIVKNGLLTDTFFANILFYNGKNWLTPAHPLLKGTQRQYLLETERIVMADIRPEDLKHFRKARLINAMLRFEDELDVEMENICF